MRAALRLRHALHDLIDAFIQPLLVVFPHLRHVTNAAENAREDSASAGVMRDFPLYYSNAKEVDAITEGLYLEIGRGGGPATSQDVPIRSIIADRAVPSLDVTGNEYEEFAPVV